MVDLLPGARVADLEPRIGALDAKLSHVEDSTLERARSAVTRAELLLLGPVRGELMGDAGTESALHPQVKPNNFHFSRIVRATSLIDLSMLLLCLRLLCPVPC